VWWKTGLDALRKLNEAKGILAKAFQELGEGIKKGDSLKVRNSCDKGWLAAVTAIDALLIRHGYEEAKTHVDRRRKLRELGDKLTEVSEMGLYDRIEARRSVLHNDGFYGGILTPEEAEEELKKVERLIEDVRNLP